MQTGLLWLLGAGALAASIALGCDLGAMGSAYFHRADEKIDGFTKHYRESLFQRTEQSLFSVEMLVKGALRVGANRVLLILHDRRDRDVIGASVSAVIRAPDGAPQGQHVAARDQSGGRYQFDSLEIEREGEVVLELRIRFQASDDRTVFRIPVGPKNPPE